MHGILFWKSQTLDLRSCLFLSPRTSIGFHKRLKITSIDFHKRSFLKEYSSMGSQNLQITLSEIKRDFPMEFPFFDSKT